MIKVPDQLTRHLKGDEKAEVETMYRSSRFLLEEMRKIVERELALTIEAEESPKLFETVFRWDLKQADYRGYRRGLRKMLKLLPSQTQEVK